VSPF